MFAFATKLYPITDVRISGLSHAEQVARLIKGGATLIQLREKQLPPREFCAQAKQALSVARARGARIIINDRVDIALALGADGVHLGQDDLPPEGARRLLGEDILIGFSIHNLEQAKAASRLPVDYLGVGPVFPTTTKDNPDPVVTLGGLRQIRDVVTAIPIVAIGGITRANAPEVLSAGADAVALVSALLQDSHEIESRTRAFLNRL